MKWRIGTLKYLEIKVEEWPSRAKWGQAGPNRAKWYQTGSNRAKRGQTGPKMTKKCFTGPNGAKRANGTKGGQMGSYYMRLIFCMQACFYEIKKSCFATQALRQKFC